MRLRHEVAVHRLSKRSLTLLLLLLMMMMLCRPWLRLWLQLMPRERCNWLRLSSADRLLLAGWPLRLRLERNLQRMSSSGQR